MNNDDSPFASRRESPGPSASPLDQAIDRAVRKMMQVDPPAGLRRRVMSRIEAGPSTRGFLGSLRTGPSTRPGFMGFVPAFAVAAALAIIVLGVVATRNSRVAPAPADAPADAVVAEKAPEPSNPVERPPQPVAAPPVRPQRVPARTPGGFRREAIPMAPVADIFGPRTAAIAAAADPIADSVWTAPTAPDVEDSTAAPEPLVVPPVGVPPIETPPIVIAPLVVGRPAAAPPAPPK